MKSIIITIFRGIKIHNSQKFGYLAYRTRVLIHRHMFSLGSYIWCLHKTENNNRLSPKNIGIYYDLPTESEKCGSPWLQ